MLLVIGLLGCVLSLKFAAIFNTIGWIRNYGSLYRKEVSRRWPMKGDAGESLLDECFGGFFPFGVKDYRLRRYVRTMGNDTAPRRIRRLILRVVQNLFEFQGLALLISAFLIFGAHVPESIMLAPRSVYGVLGATTGVLLMVTVIFLAALAFISYAVLGSYGVIFYSSELNKPGLRNTVSSANASRSDNGNPIVTEIYAYGGLLITAYVAISATTYFVSLQFGGFYLLNDKISSGIIEGNRLFDSFYWTMMMAAGSGGAGPSSIIAKVITMIGTITALLLLVIVLAGLAGITVAIPEQARRPSRQYRKVPSSLQGKPARVKTKRRAWPSPHHYTSRATIRSRRATHYASRRLNGNLRRSQVRTKIPKSQPPGSGR